MSLTKVKAGNILLTTPAASSNDVTPATTQYVTTALANMVDSAPSTLNTLNELAAALGDDANFSTTVTNSIAAKAPLASPALTGTVTAASHVQIAGNLDVVGQIGAYNNPGSSWGTMGLRATDYTFKNAGGTVKLEIDSSGNLTLGDDQHLYLGDATSDLDIYHIGGSVSVLRSTPALVVQSDDYISLGTYSGGELMLKATKNGAVDLYHDNVAKLSTKTTGVQVAGIIGVNVTANAGHSNSSGSIQIKGSNDNYQPTNFNEAAMLSLDATNSEGRYAAIRFTHEGGTEGLFGLVRATATSDITDYVWQMYDGSANAYKELFRISEQGYPQFPAMGAGSGQNAVQWWSGGGRAGGMLIYVSSSQQYKKDITDCTIDSSKIYNLQAKSFKWNEKSVHEDKEDWGMIAEEVIEHIPELGVYRDGKVDSLQYEKLSVLLLEEIKKLNERIKVLEG